MPQGQGRRISNFGSPNRFVKHAMNLPLRSKAMQYFKRDLKDFPDIVNTPLDQNGQPIDTKEVVESRRSVLKAGYHTVYRTVLPDERGGWLLRVVVA